ncbi:cytochrome P450 4V2 [Nephila pilipes]|uniref:Cytochrome P450 4V2 n=1 Tax=Nephila pilipes TaxID=299642 RepID=A0A8X6U9K7_NEPPI|nr:cytochrome P450 4V2 [Nephila pilipes]
MVLFFVIVVLSGVILILIVHSQRREKCSQNLSTIKPGFFKNLGDLINVLLHAASNDGHSISYHYNLFLKERYEQFQQQQMFDIWGFFNPCICFVKAEAVKQLLSKGTGTNEKSWTYGLAKPLMGTGLITSSVDKWKPRRKLLTPCFRADILREFLPIFNEHSQKLVEHLRRETKKEFTFIGTPVTLTALDIIYETMLGSSVGALDSNSSQYIFAMKRILDICMSRIVKFWEWPDFIFNLTSGKELKRLVKMIDDLSKSVIREKKMQYLHGNEDSSNGKRKALIDLLLKLHFETQELSEEDICEEVNTFISAGHETVSLSTTWALYLIGLYPDVQAKIHEELDRIFGTDKERDVTESDLNDLKYLNCVLKETNRLYAVVPGIGRNAKEDMNICGFKVPKGSTCFVLIYFLHRDKDVFPEPETFNPDRFLPENSVKIPEYGYIPFSAGPRNCIGQKFAVMEMKTIVSAILRNYTVESLDPRDKVLPQAQITLHPSIPIRFIEENLAFGHMEEVLNIDEIISDDEFCLPHHGVHRSGNRAHPLRIVFNGSEKLI